MTSLQSLIDRKIWAVIYDCDFGQGGKDDEPCNLQYEISCSEAEFKDRISPITTVKASHEACLRILIKFFT